MKPLTLILALLSITHADESEVLPDPPTDVTALARAEYQKAEQAFAQQNWKEAETALVLSWDHQHNHITLYDLAAVHIKQGNLIAAGGDMLQYFASAPPAIADENNAAAKIRMARIKHLRGHDGRSGREYGKAVIAEIKRGEYGGVYKLDSAIDDTQDMALVYWIVLGEYRAIKASFAAKAKQAWRSERDKHMSAVGLQALNRLLSAYFTGSTDLMDLWDAQRLFDEIDVEARRSAAFEKRCSITRENPNSACPEARGTKVMVVK